MAQWLVCVFGCSHGLGQEIVLRFGQTLRGKNTKFVLYGRELDYTEMKLQEMDRLFEILSVNSGDFLLGAPPKFSEEAGKLSQFSRIFWIFNFGTASPICSVSDLGTPGFQPAFVNQLTLNVVHISGLITSIFEWLGGAPSKMALERHVWVNISSLLAIKACASLAAYAAGKAARKALFDTLRLEHPELEVINYSPGPFGSRMTQEILAAPRCHPTFQEMMIGPLVDLEHTSLLLVDLLIDPWANQMCPSWKEADQVDYYDLLDMQPRK